MSVIYPENEEDYLFSISIKPSLDYVLRKDVEDQLLLVKRLQGELDDLKRKLKEVKSSKSVNNNIDDESKGIFMYESEWGSYPLLIKSVSKYDLNDVGLDLLDFALAKHYDQYLLLKGRGTLYYHIMLLQKEYDSQYNTPRK